MKDLIGKVVFITGGASGIGLGMAEAFAAAGMKVAIADVNASHLAQAESRLRRIAPQVLALQLDVSDREAFVRAADLAEAALGPIDVLCNNAGVGILGSLKTASYGDWDWILGVNLGGVINGIQTFLPRMLARGRGGHIVSTASAAGLFGGAGAGIYTTSKMAVVGLMECLRGDVAGDGIGVSVLCPHITRTNIHEHERLRPERFRAVRDSAGPSVATEEMERAVKSMLAVGMDPAQVGQCVVEGVRRNVLYILTHPEIRAPIRERFEAIQAAIPADAADPRRVAAEEGTLHYWVYTERQK